MSADKHPAEVVAENIEQTSPISRHIYPLADGLAMLRRIPALQAELERETIRLAACGVVAMSDTPESAARNRQMHPDYESASCRDVARRVDECMALRSERDRSRIEIKRLMQCVHLLTERNDRDNAERDQLRAEVQRWSLLAASFEAERNLLREEISDLHKANAARKQQ